MRILIILNLDKKLASEREKARMTLNAQIAWTHANKQSDTIIRYNSYTITIIIIVVVVEQIESVCVIKRIIVHFCFVIVLTENLNVSPSKNNI